MNVSRGTITATITGESSENADRAAAPLPEMSSADFWALPDLHKGTRYFSGQRERERLRYNLGGVLAGMARELPLLRATHRRRLFAGAFALHPARRARARDRDRSHTQPSQRRRALRWRESSIALRLVQRGEGRATRAAHVKGCALGPCSQSLARGGVGCYLCDVIAALPQPRTAAEVESAKREGNVTRDGIAAPKAGDALAFKRRRRVGPHR